MTQSAHERHNHFLHLCLLPKQPHLLPFSKDVFQILFVFDVFAHNTDSESVIHGFIEEITVELNDVWMVLSLEKLYGFFLIFIKLVQTFSFNFFESIELTRLSMNNLINFCVLFA